MTHRHRARSNIECFPVTTPAAAFQEAREYQKKPKKSTDLNYKIMILCGG
jgi:hypothetical protein